MTSYSHYGIVFRCRGRCHDKPDISGRYRRHARPAAYHQRRPSDLGRRLGQGKQGRLRKYVFGKRVNYSSRTVITGDSYNDIHILTVPHIVALTQYVEVRSTRTSQICANAFCEGQYVTWCPPWFVLMGQNPFDLRQLESGCRLHRPHIWMGCCAFDR